MSSLPSVRGLYPVPLLVSVGRDDSHVNRTWRQVFDIMEPLGFNLRLHQFEWNAEVTDFVVRPTVDEVTDGELAKNPQVWKRLTQEFVQKMRRIEDGVPGMVLFHLFLDCPAALAMGMGVRTRHLLPVVLYHFQGGAYVPVLDFTPAGPFGADGVNRLRTVKPPYTALKINLPPISTRQLVVMLRLSGRQIENDVRGFAVKEGRAMATIEEDYANIGATPGILPLETDKWFLVASETVSELLRLAAQHDEVHLCLNSLVPMAFAIGMGLGIHAPVSVYNWFNGHKHFSLVLELNHLGRS